VAKNNRTHHQSGKKLKGETSLLSLGPQKSADGEKEGRAWGGGGTSRKSTNGTRGGQIKSVKKKRHSSGRKEQEGYLAIPNKRGVAAIWVRKVALGDSGVWSTLTELATKRGSKKYLDAKKKSRKIKKKGKPAEQQQIIAFKTRQ